MRGLLTAIANQFLFIGVWLLLPILVEVIPIFAVYVKLSFKIVINWLKRHFHRRSQLTNQAFLPMIDVVIPVYNSADTLAQCVTSVITGTYPLEKIMITLVNNESTDQSFQIFQKLQNEFPTARINWLEAAQGKSNALNMALYNTSNKYFVHIDSDGLLDENALLNMVQQFEAEPQTVALTGIILTQISQIAQSWRLRLLQLLEYHEYAAAFLVGRNAEAGANNMFTMSGAFSGFRRAQLADTFMFSSETVGEDTHMTFQMRAKGQVKLARNAIFYVEPITDFNTLYRQRQRWQIGEMEVVHIFEKQAMLSMRHLLSNFMIRRLLVDHTFLFPRLIWFFAPLVLVAKGFSWQMLGLIYLAMYGLYVFVSGLFFLLAQVYLKPFRPAYRMYVKTWYITLLMPAYKFVLSWVLLFALLNRPTERKWQGRGLSDELAKFRQLVAADARKLRATLKREKS